MTQDIRDLRPRGRLKENVTILRGTAHSNTDDAVHSWYCWASSLDRVTSSEVLDEMRRGAA